MSGQAAHPKAVGAVETGVRILRHVAQADGPEGVASIARATDTNVSTCFNILRTLAAEGLVTFDTERKTYRLGMGVLELSAPLLGADPIDLIRPDLERLAREHAALIALWNVTRNDRIVLADKVVSMRIVHVDMAVGSRLPAHIGAVGRCVAAAQELEGDALEARFKALRWQAAPSFEDYAADVERARRDGYAFDFGQLFVGVDIAAAVVRDHAGRPRFGISGITVAGQMTREALDALARAIRDRAETIGARLYARVAEREKESEQPASSVEDKPPATRTKRTGASRRSAPKGPSARRVASR